MKGYPVVDIEPAGFRFSAPCAGIVLEHEERRGKIGPDIGIYDMGKAPLQVTGP